MNHPARARGFTLIEVIIAMAIVAILVAVALPAYRDHMRKSRRAEAQAYLMAVASRQQQFLLDTRGYAPDLTTVGIPAPANVSAAYDLAVAAVAGPPPSFRLTATPKADDRPDVRALRHARDRPDRRQDGGPRHLLVTRHAQSA